MIIMTETPAYNVSENDLKYFKTHHRKAGNDFRMQAFA